MDNSWERLENKEKREVIDAFNSLKKEKEKELENIVIQYRELPFYRNALMLETKSKNKVEYFIWLKKDKELRKVNFSNSLFYNLNEKKDILNFDEENNKIYIKTFFEFVKGKHGHFIIVEQKEDIINNMIENDRKKFLNKIQETETGVHLNEDEPVTFNDNEADLLETIQPIRFLEKKKKTWIYSAYMVFKDSLFKANIHVDEDGMVSLSEEKLLIEGIKYTINQQHIFEREVPKENKDDIIKKYVKFKKTELPYFNAAQVDIDNRNLAFLAMDEKFYRIFDFELNDGLLHHIVYTKDKIYKLDKKEYYKVENLDPKNEIAIKEYVLFNLTYCSDKVEHPFKSIEIETSEVTDKEILEVNCTDIRGIVRSFKVDLIKGDIEELRQASKEQENPKNNQNYLKELEEAISKY